MRMTDRRTFRKLVVLETEEERAEWGKAKKRREIRMLRKEEGF